MLECRLYAIKNKSLVLEDSIYVSRSSHVYSLELLGITDVKVNGNITTTFT
jgi:hypothetical protein